MPNNAWRAALLPRSHPPPNFIEEIEHERDMILRLLVFGPNGRQERENAPAIGRKIEIRENASIGKPPL